MELTALKLLLGRVNGCTFATIDTTTHPRPSIRKITVGTRIMLFTNRNKSGYEEMVRRRLIEAGKDPDDFSLGDLPFGERVPNSPLIIHHGLYYLQTVILEPGQSTSYLGNQEINLEDFFPRPRTNQGLPREDEVVVRTYRIDNIDRIALMGEVLVAERDQLTPLGT